MSKVIVHIDLNTFFASCEALKDPSVKGKPLIVAGSQRRSIVSTANYEARKYGIKSGMATYQALKLCPHVINKEPDFKLYSHYSSLFFNYLKENFTSHIEVASIDECYIDATSVLSSVKDPVAYLKNLQQTLLKELGLGCSIGVGPTKFLAKMASNYQKPLGLTVFRRKELANTVWKLPIEEMYGVGVKTAPRLKEIGINTIKDLALSNSEEVKNVLGKGYITLYEWANGYGSDEVALEEEDLKSIGHSSTFMFDTDDYDEISSLFRTLSSQVSKRAINEHKVAMTIQIVIRYDTFITYNRSVTLTKPTNNELKIFNEVMKLFDKNYTSDPVRLLGVTLQNLSEEGSLVEQLSLFDNFDTKSKTDMIIDLLNEELDGPLFKRLSEIKK